ncbi:hypothetical protein B0H10DRAFT_777716 [Mycena sp. CBHHK59/15]|nr:hypothetical protein B0H10DRAFT_777716 [Mycena sp. CBHHK59/15]
MWTPNRGGLDGAAAHSFPSTVDAADRRRSPAAKVRVSVPLLHACLTSPGQAMRQDRVRGRGRGPRAPHPHAAATARRRAPPPGRPWRGGQHDRVGGARVPGTTRRGLGRAQTLAVQHESGLATSPAVAVQRPDSCASSTSPHTDASDTAWTHTTPPTTTPVHSVARGSRAPTAAACQPSAVHSPLRDDMRIRDESAACADRTRCSTTRRADARKMEVGRSGRADATGPAVKARQRAALRTRNPRADPSAAVVAAGQRVDSGRRACEHSRAAAIAALRERWRRREAGRARRCGGGNAERWGRENAGGGSGAREHSRASAEGVRRTRVGPPQGQRTSRAWRCAHSREAVRQDDESARALQSMIHHPRCF